MNLKDKDIKPCPEGAKPYSLDQIAPYLKELSSHWEISNGGKCLKMSLNTKDFNQSLVLAQLAGKIADEQWHHPEITIGFKKFELEIYTHDCGGLWESDFIYASKIDSAFSQFDFK